MPRLPALILLLTLALGATRIASAQDVLVKTFPAPPLPSECVVDPVSEDRLTSRTPAYLATPLATPSEPVSALSLFPNSESVGSQARKEIEAIEHQLVACYNAGDWRRAAALYTDDYLARIVAASADRVMEFFPPEPQPLDPMDWMTMVVDDVRRIEGGYVVALVDYCSHEQVHYYLQGTEGWRIDDSLDVPTNDDGICEILPTLSTPIP